MSRFICRLTLSIIVMRINTINLWDLRWRAIGCVRTHFDREASRSVLLDERMVEIDLLAGFSLLHVRVDLSSIVYEDCVDGSWVVYSFF